MAYSLPPLLYTSFFSPVVFLSRYFWLDTVVLAADVAAVSYPFNLVALAGLLTERSVLEFRKATERRLVELEFEIEPTFEMAC